MKKNDQIKEIIKNLCENKDGSSLISFNEDGSLNIKKDEQSDYSFVVFDEHREFKGLLDKLLTMGYSFDLDTHPAIFHGLDLIRIDVSNKTVTRVLIVSIRHYLHLKSKGSILLKDVLDNFEEIVINKNKALAYSLYQSQRSRS